MAGLGATLDATAAFLGVETSELTSELASGKDLLTIAVEHGKTPEELRAFLIEQATARIDAFLSLTDEAGPGA
jgi:hypothetical protein